MRTLFLTALLSPIRSINFCLLRFDMKTKYLSLENLIREILNLRFSLFFRVKKVIPFKRSSSQIMKYKKQKLNFKKDGNNENKYYASDKKVKNRVAYENGNDYGYDYEDDENFYFSLSYKFNCKKYNNKTRKEREREGGGGKMSDLIIITVFLTVETKKKIYLWVM